MLRKIKLLNIYNNIINLHYFNHITVFVSEREKPNFLHEFRKKFYHHSIDFVYCTFVSSSLSTHLNMSTLNAQTIVDSGVTVLPGPPHKNPRGTAVYIYI